MAVFEFGESARPIGLIAEVDCGNMVINFKTGEGVRAREGETLCSIPISGYLLLRDQVEEELRQRQLNAEGESAFNIGI